MFADGVKLSDCEIDRDDWLAMKPKALVFAGAGVFCVVYEILELSILKRSLPLPWGSIVGVIGVKVRSIAGRAAA